MVNKMISFDSWRTPLQLIDNKLQLDVNGLKVALIKKGLRPNILGQSPRDVMFESSPD